MPTLEPDVIEGILVSRGAPFARNKGFSERFDEVFQESGFAINASNHLSLLYDVRSLYGFFLWLQNQSASITIPFTVFFSYNNFDKVTDLAGSDGAFDPDWVAALESDGVTPIAGTLAIDGGDEEIEFVRVTARVTAVRIDFTPASNVTINGSVNAV